MSTNKATGRYTPPREKPEPSDEDVEELFLHVVRMFPDKAAEMLRAMSASLLEIDVIIENDADIGNTTLEEIQTVCRRGLKPPP